MKLYYSPGACSLAVRIAINEMGTPCEYEAVDLKTKKTASGADYLTINPKGAVPCLQLDNKEVLTENAVIQEYLADTNKANSLFPPLGDPSRYRVAEWLNFISTDLHKGCSPLFNPQVPEDMKETIFRVNVKNKLTVLDKHLATHKFLMGNQFTLPDGYLFVILSWLPGLKIDIKQFPHLGTFFQHVKERKAVQKSLQEEGILERFAN
jgi:glutathione S-transferase